MITTCLLLIPAVLAAITLPAAAADHDTNDQTFVATASSSGMKEVDIAKVGVERATTPGVKNLAQKLVTDHTKANEELNTLATKKGITIPMKQSNAASMAFASKTGADFDKEFLKTVEASHEKEIELFEKQATIGTDTDLKNWANQTLPTLRAHLAEIRNLLK